MIEEIMPFAEHLMTVLVSAEQLANDRLLGFVAFVLEDYIVLGVRNMFLYADFSQVEMLTEHYQNLIVLLDKFGIDNTPLILSEIIHEVYLEKVLDLLHSQFHELVIFNVTVQRVVLILSIRCIISLSGR